MNIIHTILSLKELFFPTIVLEVLTNLPNLSLWDWIEVELVLPLALLGYLTGNGAICCHVYTVDITAERIACYVPATYIPPAVLLESKFDGTLLVDEIAHSCLGIQVCTVGYITDDTATMTNLVEQVANLCLVAYIVSLVQCLSIVQKQFAIGKDLPEALGCTAVVADQDGLRNILAYIVTCWSSILVADRIIAMTINHINDIGLGAGSLTPLTTIVKNGS